MNPICLAKKHTENISLSLSGVNFMSRWVAFIVTPKQGYFNEKNVL
jgi:hypothetical protein